MFDENESFNVNALTEDTIRKLEASGLRMTVQRRRIIEILTSSKCTSPKELWYEAKQFVPDLGIATVYRLINRLEQIGLISKNRNLGMLRVEPILGVVADEKGRKILNQGTVKDLELLIKQGLVQRGTISSMNNVRLSLVGDKINVTVI